MPRLFPFVGLTYDERVAGPLARLTAPPYDVISGERRRAALDASPYNIVHLDLAEGGADPSSTDSRYLRAAGKLARWRETGALTTSPEPSFYAYEMRFQLSEERRRVRGVLCALELEPWGRGVLPHEEVMPGPVQDRLDLLRATSTHLSPVYGTVAGPSAPLTDLLAAVCATDPSASILDEEGVTHSIWRVGEEVAIASWLADDALLIADGHHRYTTALHFREEMRARRGPGPWDRILTLVVDAGSQDVPVLPYHRIQRRGEAPMGGEPAGDLGELLSRLRDRDLTYGTASLSRTGATIYGLHRLAGDPPTVHALHRQVLDEGAPGDALAFTHDAHDADSAVREGRAVAAFFLPPTTPDLIRKVVERGERLPRKSTFFWPKPRTGMVLMPLDAPPG